MLIFLLIRILYLNFNNVCHGIVVEGIANHILTGKIQSKSSLSISYSFFLLLYHIFLVHSEQQWANG